MVGAINGEDKGQWGVEKEPRVLSCAARPSAYAVLTDSNGRGIASHVEPSQRPGPPVTLSIDECLQFPAERAIARAVQDAHAESGSVVVMDPRSGDILAMASYPGFDPSQQPAPGEKPSVRFNHAVSVPFEPGSVFKVITLSSALETTPISCAPESLINCGGGSITLFGRTIHEAHGGYGILPMAMVLAKSSNIGAIQVGMRVGQNNLYNYVRRFGFGERSGIPLPAESSGMVRKLTRWGKTSLSSVSMGHEIGVTTLQLAQACSVVANGGMLVRPRLILRNGDQAAPTVSPRRVLQPETAITMRQMMEGVVLFGTGRRYANLQGYSAAGKTGSAGTRLTRRATIRIVTTLPSWGLHLLKRIGYRSSSDREQGTWRLRRLWRPRGRSDLSCCRHRNAAGPGHTERFAGYPARKHACNPGRGSERRRYSGSRSLCAERARRGRRPALGAHTGRTAGRDCRGRGGSSTCRSRSRSGCGRRSPKYPTSRACLSAP